jgi:hypothetical protein
MKPIRATVGDLRPGDVWFVGAQRRSGASVEFIVPVDPPAFSRSEDQFLRIRSHGSGGWRSTMTLISTRAVYLFERTGDPAQTTEPKEG